MKKRFWKSVLATVLGTLLAFGMIGCGSSDPSTSSDGTVGNSQEAEGVVYKTALTEELNSLDPNYNYSATSMGMIANVNEGLYKYLPDGTIGMGLAESVDISEDGCTYTFHIRDAKWSNGDPVTANDFEYSWKRLANPENGCTYAYMLITAGVKNALSVCYGGGDLESLGVSAPDEKTFVVELDAARAYFPQLLAMGTYFMPVNQAFCEASGDQFMLDKEHSIYCGPYVMSEWEVGGTTYKCTKNPDYYDKDSITCVAIEYTLLTDVQQKILAYQSGKLDIVQLTGDYIAMYAGDPAIYQNGYPGLFFIAFNTENQYLSNKNLRLAISTAIKKETIVDSILADGSSVANYAIPHDFAKDSKGVTYAENAGFPEYNVYDPVKAASYFEAAKKELGTDSITLEFLYNEDSNLASIAAYIQSELQTNLPGLTINLKCESYNQRLADMGAGNYDFGITRWYADYQDASTYLDMWTEGSSLNYENWHNAEYNELYHKVIGEYAMDEENRIATQIAMEKMVLDDAIICPLYQPVTTYLRNTNLEFKTDANGNAITKYITYKSK